MKTLLFCILSLFALTSCITVQAPSSHQTNHSLKQSDLENLLTAKAKADRLAEPLLSSSSTRDMIDGGILFANELRQAYVDLVRKTRGNSAFQGLTPTEWADRKIEPAAEAAEKAYAKRFAAGLDGSAGRLDAPSARITRVNELIEQEVRNHTSPQAYQQWLPRWKAL